MLKKHIHSCVSLSCLHALLQLYNSLLFLLYITNLKPNEQKQPNYFYRQHSHKPWTYTTSGPGASRAMGPIVGTSALSLNIHRGVDLPKSAPTLKELL